MHDSNQHSLLILSDEMVGKFVWEDYLNDTTCIAAPPDIFKKVSVQFLFLYFVSMKYVLRSYGTSSVYGKMFI